jgi:hypothetical protein
LDDSFIEGRAVERVLSGSSSANGEIDAQNLTIGCPQLPDAPPYWRTFEGYFEMLLYLCRLGTPEVWFLGAHWRFFPSPHIWVDTIIFS